MNKTLQMCLLSAFAFALAACEKSTQETNQDATLSFVSGTAQSDTISAELASNLAVRVTGPDGKGQAGVPVLFTTQEVACRVSQSACYPLKFASATGEYLPMLTLLTGADGVAKARIRLGEIASTPSANVSVPLYNLVASTNFTVRPGQPVHVTLVNTPADTVLELGESFQVSATATDRGFNPAGVAGFTFDASSSAVIIDATGKVTANLLGTALLWPHGFPTDTMRVNVAPTARIAVSALHGPIRLSTLKGSAEKVLMNGNVNAQDWAPDGRLVYVDDRGNGNYALSVMDTLAVTRQLPVPLSSTWPQFSKDGNWIYFFVQEAAPQICYRIHPDGSGMELLMNGSFPTPSPDGTRFAAVTGTAIFVGNVTSKAGTTIPVNNFPIALRWSPDGQHLAYRTNYSVVVMRTDGTDVRSFPSVPGGGLAWSPDSRWLLTGAATGGRLTLTDTQVGNTFNVYTTGTYPAWK